MWRDVLSCGYQKPTKYDWSQRAGGPYSVTQKVSCSYDISITANCASRILHILILEAHFRYSEISCFDQDSFKAQLCKLAQR